MVNNMEKKLKAYVVTGIATVAALAAMIGVYQNIDQDNGKDAKIVQEAQQETDINEMAAGQSETNEMAAGQTSQNQGSLDNAGVEYEGYEDTRQTLAEREVANRQDLSGAGTIGENLSGDAATGGAEGEAPDVTTDGEKLSEKTAEGTGAGGSSEAAFSQKKNSFGKNSSIQWPVKGNVLMNYSMDKTTYFATLDQYKYNPALIIQAKVNDKVIAGVAGTVETIATTEETGTTVTLDLGNGYRAIYGQLKEVKKEKGDTVAADEVLGYITEPTKYYSLEGSNLYFAMEKDGEPINPMEFLK